MKRIPPIGICIYNRIYFRQNSNVYNIKFICPLLSNYNERQLELFIYRLSISESYYICSGDFPKDTQIHKNHLHVLLEVALKGIHSTSRSNT